MSKVERIITSRAKDLGGFCVRRLLPYESHCMVGPFIFFDHMGPAEFNIGQGIDVRPHPHIHLATVTYLFSGKIQHRDSLGSNQLIEPGDINWMTAGKGIVHSERTPESLRQTPTTLEGIQCWIALPESHENCAPTFTHFSKDVLPEFTINGVKLKLLLGKLFNFESPIPTHSDLFYLNVNMPKGTTLYFPADDREAAIYVTNGRVNIEGNEVDNYSMAILQSKENIAITSLVDSHLMLLGGKSLGERFIYWNFVSSSWQKIAEAKAEWLPGPGQPGSRFPKIPGDEVEFIPLPIEKGENPKGTIM